LYIDKLDTKKLKNGDIETIKRKINGITKSIEKRNQICIDSETIDAILNVWLTFENKNCFYYTYELDFRMRLYPHTTKCHPMGNLLSRSLVQYTEKYPFVEEVFKIYTTKLYFNCLSANKAEILTMYNTTIISQLENFRNEKTMKEIFEKAEDPYSFFAQCILYEEWKISGYSKNFKTKNIIYLDATASGPQIISLLFLLKDFAEYLNLQKQEEDVRPGDFYLGVLKMFFQKEEYAFWIKEEKRKEIIEKEFSAELGYLRNLFKISIMTQFYGVTYITFREKIIEPYQKKRRSMIKFLLLQKKIK